MPCALKMVLDVGKFTGQKLPSFDAMIKLNSTPE
jgi:hypothetical protein